LKRTYRRLLADVRRADDLRDAAARLRAAIVPFTSFEIC